MQTYLVGGAVRDSLLNIPVKDRDWVVVGATPDLLLNKGFQQVGADFPVFLHPETKEEYALARTERKSGHGYTGFEVSFDSSVTLEDDLLRRDLTINAMALDDNNHLVDPFNGQQDLEDRVLRHVSDAFREDPLRVLRVARFSARFAHLGFTVAPETLSLMRDIAASGELKHLTAERVWVEMSRALLEETPSEFFKVLRQAKALKEVFPELDALFGVPQPMRWHPEIDTGIHTLKALDIARKKSDNVSVLLATLCHDLGKALTPSDRWPSHRGHEGFGADLIKQINKNYKWPTKPATLAEVVARYHTHCHTVYKLKPSTILDLLIKINGFRQPERVEQFVLACESDARGRSGLESIEYPQGQFLLKCLEACEAITSETYVAAGLTGKAIGDAIYRDRINSIKGLQDSRT